MLSRRKWIQKVLEFGEGTTPSEISERLWNERREELSPDEVVTEIQHLSQSLDNSEQRLEWIPPECRDCGFDNFSKQFNIPSQCPNKNCRSEYITDPVYRIATV